MKTCTTCTSLTLETCVVTSVSSAMREKPQCISQCCAERHSKQAPDRDVDQKALDLVVETREYTRVHLD
jgi:hypothetical protein